MKQTAHTPDPIDPLQESSEPFDWRYYLHVVLERWWLVCLCLLLGAILSVFLISREKTLYGARAVLFIETQREQVLDGQMQSVRDVEIRSIDMINTIIETLNSYPMAERVAKRLELATDPAFIKAVDWDAEKDGAMTVNAAAGSLARARRACRRGGPRTPLHGSSPAAWPGCSCSTPTAGSGAPHQGAAGGAASSWVATGCVRPPRSSIDNHSCGTDTGGGGGHLDSVGCQPFGSCGRSNWGIRLRGWSWLAAWAAAAAGAELAPVAIAAEGQEDPCEAGASDKAKQKITHGPPPARFALPPARGTPPRRANRPPGTNPRGAP